jgi:hypothetical protein
VRICYRKALLSTHLHVSFPRATAGLVTISNRAALLIYYETLNQDQQQVKTYRLQGSDNVHYSACQYPSVKPQPVKSLSD